MSRRRRRKLPTEPVTVSVTDLAHDGRGVGHVDGKAVFVHGALPGEVVSARIIDRARKHDEALCLDVIEASPERIEPGCPWFDSCGGCALQHLDHGAQLRWKHKRLVDNLQRIGEVEPRQWLAPLSDEPWLYRRRARLSARWVKGKGRVLVGFREPQGRYVADVGYCRVLHPDFSERLESLSALLGRLSVADAVPQVETASGDNGSAIVIRNLNPLTDEDLEILRQWSAEEDIAVYLQPKGPDTVFLLAPDEHQLSYRLEDFGLELFCGLGNFTLPLATRSAHVTGIEGAPELIAAAADNARANRLDNIELDVADLSADVSHKSWFRAGFDAVLIDPPRSGAFEILPVVAGCGARRVVYVSCNPATLARDAGELVRTHGFELVSAGIADMFPHTAHVESIALFERRS
jgi:23S rRNA (uracil1939-C5)-methyltransferase